MPSSTRQYYVVQEKTIFDMNSRLANLAAEGWYLLGEVRAVEFKPSSTERGQLIYVATLEKNTLYA
jgi:hypothetical protein